MKDGRSASGHGANGSSVIDFMPGRFGGGQETCAARTPPRAATGVRTRDQRKTKKILYSREEIWSLQASNGKESPQQQPGGSTFEQVSQVDR